MKLISTLSAALVLGLSATAQTTITNGGFELWGNTVPAGDTHEEPTNWYSNQSGSSTAALGGQTCFKDATVVHSGSYSVRMETISGPFSTVINGSVTTGVVDAPTITKTDGYIGTVNYSTSSDDRRMSFTGRPDSLVGWYQYTSGGTGEQAKIRVILHTGDYYDPETPTTYHPDPTANKIADGLFLSTPSTSVSVWTRFSIPFTYVSAASPAYIMINATPSANQGTTIVGSKLWLDDLEVVYVTAAVCDTVMGLAASTITASSATISWTAVSGAAGYIYAVDNSPTPPVSGTFTTATSVPVTGLTSSTLYYAHVRDTCGPGNVSAWVTTSFPTTTSVHNSVASGFSVTAFPNPVKDELTINIAGVENVRGQIELTDVTGRVLKTTTADAATVHMGMNGLPAGVYLVKYVDAKHTQTIKINKQ